MKIFFQKNIGIFLILLGGLLLAFVAFRSQPGELLRSGNEISIGGKTWKVEYARTAEERELGLGYRERLCGQCGMLFVFPMAGEYGFWMKGMRFPLDILFIEDGRVLSIERRVTPESEQILMPPGPVTLVLEVNAGETEGISLGMPVSGLPRSGR
ncbi:MAG: DUF192 domain-containing protein [Candidatus Moraniibacteriota bacterium]